MAPLPRRGGGYKDLTIPPATLAAPEGLPTASAVRNTVYALGYVNMILLDRDTGEVMFQDYLLWNREIEAVVCDFHV